VGLHGRLKTNRREKLIRNFMKRSNGCLFATDVVSRGIDFDHIHFIVQIDPPEDPDNYVHRIGRTARINRPGTVIFSIT
jgi:superfamily II DNA/RNA helicase